MNTKLLIFPFQLFSIDQVNKYTKTKSIILAEHPLFFFDEKQPLKFHKKKLILHRASMQAYQKELVESGFEVEYLNYQDIKKYGQLFERLKEQDIQIFNPVDYILTKRIKKFSSKFSINIQILKTPYFLNTTKENQEYFIKQKNKFFQHSFYIQQRKKLNILINPDGTPIGGKWSYDADNRKKLPKDIELPPIPNFAEENQNIIQEATDYIQENFPDHPGEVSNFFYPLTHKQAQLSLQDFLQKRIHLFGDYEDAISQNDEFIFHSILSSPLNNGLLTPDEVVTQTLNFHEQNNIPLNSLEGFIRQIISWREFMRATYEILGSKQRTTNFWKHTNKLPYSFWDATTSLPPIDITIKKVLQNAYSHHIERLMVLGNIMCLLEIDPDDVYKWFMEMYIDAYDWVMVPNVYSMSQFADGGLVTTKPYISSSNYIRKMSNFSKGEWEQTWTALYWRFINKHRDFFSKNFRLNMMVKMYDKKSSEDKAMLNSTAEKFIKSLTKN